MGKLLEQPMPSEVVTSPDLPFVELSSNVVQPYVNSVPLFDLRFAAGDFSLPQMASDAIWVQLPDYLQARPGLFVARVNGESMNRVIPNGSWCLFRANPMGSRQGKTVVVETQEFGDPELGGRFTIKRYRSEKVITEDEFQHDRITLSPESSEAGFEAITLVADGKREFRVVAEFLAVL
jgi:SOS-response transcriptional repressor LexA